MLRGWLTLQRLHHVKLGLSKANLPSNAVRKTELAVRASPNPQVVAKLPVVEVVPASVAWLVRALARRGEGLTAGMTVLSGACTAAFAVAPGDTVVARVDRLGTVEVTCR